MFLMLKSNERAYKKEYSCKENNQEGNQFQRESCMALPVQRLDLIDGKVS